MFHGVYVDAVYYVGNAQLCVASQVALALVEPFKPPDITVCTQWVGPGGIGDLLDPGG